jgi:hypothetical protein
VALIEEKIRDLIIIKKIVVQVIMIKKCSLTIGVNSTPTRDLTLKKKKVHLRAKTNITEICHPLMREQLVVAMVIIKLIMGKDTDNTIKGDISELDPADMISQRLVAALMISKDGKRTGINKIIGKLLNGLISVF